MVIFTINIPQMLAYIPYMDPMGNIWKNEIHVPNHQPVIDLPPKIVIFHSYASLLEGTQKWKGPPNVMFVGL